MVWSGAPGRPAAGAATLGLCILGCGRFAAFHARAARRLGPAVAVSFASREPGRADAFRHRFGGVAAFGSYEAALADPRVDAVVVCTPHHLHAELAWRAAGQGKAILVEKPMARTLAEADAMLAAARAAGVVLMVAENLHFMPAFVAARRELRAGAIGPVRQVVVNARGYRPPGAWRRRREHMGGGVLIDGGIHYVHLLRDWAGPVAAVTASAPPNLLGELEGEDSIFLLLRFAGGAVGSLACSLASPGLPSWQWAVATGSEGSLGVDHRGRALWVWGRGRRRLRVFLRDRRGLVRQLREFVGAVRDDGPAGLSPESAREDLATVLAAYRSLVTGRSQAPGEA
jgi:predicted dehydrogenase